MENELLSQSAQQQQLDSSIIIEMDFNKIGNQTAMALLKAAKSNKNVKNLIVFIFRKIN